MTTNDVAAVNAIGNETPELSVTEGNSLFWGIKRLTSWVKAEQDVMLVAAEGDEVVGFVITQLHIPSQIGYLSDIVVKSSARGQGIGAQLTQQAIKRMKDLGITYIYALTQQNNQPIQLLLVQNGFDKGESMTWFESRP